MADTVVQCSANELLRVLRLEQRLFRVDFGSCHDHFLSHWWLSDRVHAGHPISERLPWQADNLFMLQLEDAKFIKAPCQMHCIIWQRRVNASSGEKYPQKTKSERMALKVRGRFWFRGF